MNVINSMPIKLGESITQTITTSCSEPVAIKVHNVNNGALLQFDCMDATLTFKGDDTVFGGDKVVKLSGIGYYSLDLGGIVQKSGEYKDHVLIETDATGCDIGLIELI